MLYVKKKGKIRLEVYRPKRKLNVSKEDTLPLLVKVGSYFIVLGGIFSFIFSGIVMGIKSFFHVKQKIYDKNIFNKKYVEVRIKKRK